MSKIKSFINSQYWKEIIFPSQVKDWKKCEFNNKSISFNVLFIENDKEEINQVYISKYNFNPKNKVIPLITDCEKWHYLWVKYLLLLLRGIASLVTHLFVLIIHLIPNVEVSVFTTKTIYL